MADTPMAWRTVLPATPLVQAGTGPAGQPGQAGQAAKPLRRRWLAGWRPAGGRRLVPAAGHTLGIVVPLLPTVDFYVMAAVCFGRGSRRWAQWLLNQPHIGSCGGSLSKLSHACGRWEIPTGP